MVRNHGTDLLEDSPARASPEPQVRPALSTVRPLARDLRALIGWPFPLGFGLGGRLLLAWRGRVCVKFTIINADLFCRGDDDELINTNPPTPCQEQAPVQTKTQRKIFVLLTKSFMGEAAGFARSR